VAKFRQTMGRKPPIPLSQLAQALIGDDSVAEARRPQRDFAEIRDCRATPWPDAGLSLKANVK